MSGIAWDDERPAGGGVVWDDEKDKLDLAGGAKAFARGAGQGVTLGFGDEIAGAMGAGMQGLANLLPEGVRDSLGLVKASAGDAYRSVRDDDRADNRKAEADHGAAYLGGNLAGGVLLPVPGGAAAAGASGGARLLRAVAQGGALGAGYGLGSSEAGTAGGLARDTLVGGVAGGGAGALGQALGAGATRLGNFAKGKVSGIEAGVRAAAEKEAAAATASARSAAGHAAQDAYKQLEHLRELGAKGLLVPEQAAVAVRLEAELAAKAQDKLLPAAAKKEATAALLREASETEAQRAQQLAAQKLSGSELKQQVGARLKRYGLPALGGAALAAITGNDSPSGLLLGAGGGALGGAGLRPMMHSLLRMSKQPVVQRPLWQLLQSAAEHGQLAAPALDRAAGPASRASVPSLAAVLAGLLDEEDQPSYATAPRPP